jgi:transposase
MIVIGADTHKRSHTLAAVREVTGRVLADCTVRAKRASFQELLVWARALEGERVWAIEDCRHVSGALERFLLAHGERVVRVPPKLMAGARKSAREPGKSDVIDATAIARAAIREGIDALPVAQLAGAELDVRLLVDHRERLIAQRTRLINELRWELHDLWPELEVPPRVLPAPAGRNGSAVGWHAPPRRHVCVSHATSCVASVSSPARSTGSRASSGRSCARLLRDSSPSLAAGP